MKNTEWNDYGAITGPLIATLILLILAFSPVLDAKMWNLIKDLVAMGTPVMAGIVAYFAYLSTRRRALLGLFERDTSNAGEN